MNSRLSGVVVLMIRIEQFIESVDSRNGLLVINDKPNHHSTMMRTALNKIGSAGHVPIEIVLDKQPANFVFRILDLNPRGFFVVDARGGFSYQQFLVLKQATKPCTPKIVNHNGKSFEFTGKIVILADSELEPSLQCQLVNAPILETA